MPKANAPSPAPSPEEKAPEQTQKKSKNWLIIIIMGILIAMVIFLCSSLAYVLVSGSGGFDLFDTEEESDEEDGDDDSDSTDSDSEEDDGDDDSDEEDVITMEPFTGTYVDGQHPEGWTIIEYVDGNGTNMMVEGITYIGLTGLKVVAPGSKDVFTMKAVSGIGGTDACQEYYKFSDSSEAYYTDVVDRSAVSGVIPTVVDLTSQTYTYFEFFGLRTRRINTDLYWDTSSSTTTFDAACGIGAEFWWFDELQFKADGMNTSGYELTIDGTSTSAEKITLDGILYSLEAK